MPLALWRRCVKPGAAMLADHFHRTHFAQAVGHALGDPPLDAQSSGNVAGMKRIGQPARQQAAELARPAEFVNFEHRDEPLILDLVVARSSPAAAAVARVTPFFDFDQRHFQHQLAMRVDTREVDQLVEQVDKPAALQGFDGAGRRGRRPGRASRAPCGRRLASLAVPDVFLPARRSCREWPTARRAESPPAPWAARHRCGSGRRDVPRRRRRSDRAPSVGGGVWFPSKAAGYWLSLCYGLPSSGYRPSARYRSRGR